MCLVPQGRLMNRTRGFVNLNRFKSGKAIKRFSKADYHKRVLDKRESGQNYPLK